MTRDNDFLALGNARDSRLYRLFMEHLPNHNSIADKHVLKCANVAKYIGISDKALYKWVEHEYVQGRRIPVLINLEGSTLTPDLLLPFMSR